MNPTASDRIREARSIRGEAVVQARAQERDTRFQAERLEREASAATDAWKRAVKIRERAELWQRAEELRAELAQVENAAASIRL